MVWILKQYFSVEKRANRLEVVLQKAISSNNLQTAVSCFSKEYRLLFKHQKGALLSKLILAYGSKIEDISLLKKSLSQVDLKESVSFLLEHKYDSAALKVCELFAFDTQVIQLLAKAGNANELAAYLAKDNFDKESLETVVFFWEKYNGDIRKSPAMCNVFINIGKVADHIIPDIARVKQIMGQLEKAALLYLKEKNLSSAAMCYEQAGMHKEAFELYLELEDKEGSSRTAEALGDFEKALEYVVKPERRIILLIKTERFVEARKFASGLIAPDKYFKLIKEKATERMTARIKAHDFIGALELADVAECDDHKIQEILLLGRQHLNRSIASSSDDKSVYRDRVRLEEKAGNFEEAGRLAEEVLEDRNLASLLYEKANLFNRAISVTGGDSKDRLIRVAKLHEKGGNLLSAAKLYESVGDFAKAYAIYESIQHFGKAIECYLKTAEPEQENLISLYSKAGEFEKVVDLYLKSGTFYSVEKALLIAKNHNMASHIRVLEAKMAELVSGSQEDLNTCFAQAKDEVLNSYCCTFGIDFGTTNSVVAIFNKINKKVEIVPTATSSEFEPSFFGVDENNRPIVGEAAQVRSLIAPDCVVGRVKRSLGGGGNYSVGGKQYKCEEIVAKILQKLSFNLNAYLKTKVETRFKALLSKRKIRFSEEVLRAFLNSQKDYIQSKNVVLSVPAYFNDTEKKATRDAAQICGLNVRRLVHEPTAAALAYASQRSFLGKLAVIDFGGGTLDISIVDVGEGVYEVEEVGGHTKLGGSDIDKELLRFLIKDIKAKIGIDITQSLYKQDLSRLRHACETLKINLSSTNQDALELRHFLNKPRYTYNLKRTELEQIAKPVLDRLRDVIEKMVTNYPSKVEHFLLVGNATKMPAVSKLAEGIIKGKQLRGIDPGTVVGRGAALLGAILEEDLKELLLLDVVPYSLGIAVRGEDAKEEKISRLIEKNSTIPIQKNDVYSTKEDNQTSVNVRIYQGESPHPQKNHFLGNFILDKIAPAPAGTPKIEVIFAIDVDCTLNVTAVDQATGRKQSIMLEDAVSLSPIEKKKLRKHFMESEDIYSLEKNLEAVRLRISALESLCTAQLERAEQDLKHFRELFCEKVETCPNYYKVSREQIQVIQDMFIQQATVIAQIPIQRDKLASILGNIKKAETKHLDFSEKNIILKLQRRIDVLTGHERALESMRESFDARIAAVLSNWIGFLKAMQPNLDQMDDLKLANYHLIEGRVNKAIEILVSMESSEKGLDREGFDTLLKCYVRAGLSEEYKQLHKRYGSLFGRVYPDFARLNIFLKEASSSVFMIQGASESGFFSGSGFCIAADLIVTNRHVVEGAILSTIQIIGKDKVFQADKVQLDTINDLAIIKVSGGGLKALRVGEFNFIEPGEQVICIGFPAPDTNVHNEDIYISSGIVNSIRKPADLAERVIFMDANIEQGMSGGPLLNELGEVVGVLTWILPRYKIKDNEKVYLGSQPIALPVHLINNLLPWSPSLPNACKA
jgi:molecular chaperone DnaK